MFEAAASKLEDARINLETMRNAVDAISFRSGFNSFLSNCRAVTYALQKEGRKLIGFTAWYTEKQKVMKNDPLLQFIHQSRTEDFHEGRHRLSFTTFVEYLGTDNLGPPPQEGASLVIRADGPYWVVDKGTPRESYVPVATGSRHTVIVAVADPPVMHLNNAIVSTDPISLCQLAADYMGELIYEARSKFATNL